MADTIKLPAIGPVKKTYVYAGAALVAGIVGYAYWRSAQNAAADAADDTSVDYGSTDTTNADEYGTDYGAYDYSYAGSDPYYSDPYGGQGYTYDYTDSYGDSSTYLQPPATDQQWAQQAISFLESTGVEAGSASSSIGTYMGGLCLTSDQADLIRRALATVGDPPQSHRTVYICPSNGGGTTTPPSGGGSTKPTRKNITGLHVSSKGKNHLVLQWNPISGADGYTVWVSGKRWASFQYSNGSVWGLKPHSRHKITVCWNVKGTCYGHQSIYATTSK